VTLLSYLLLLDTFLLLVLFNVGVWGAWHYLGCWSAVSMSAICVGVAEVAAIGKPSQSPRVMIRDEAKCSGRSTFQWSSSVTARDTSF
jgi:hypothetical protein